MTALARKSLIAATFAFVLMACNAWAGQAPEPPEGFDDWHPVYRLLWQAAPKYADAEALPKYARGITLLASGRYEQAAAIFLPLKDKALKKINATGYLTQEEKGGDNPVYWACLRLACEGGGMPPLYDATLGNAEVTPPFEAKVNAFARSLVAEGGGYKVWSKREAKRKERMDAFYEQMVESGLFGGS